MASLTMLISWEIWKERNSRVFRHHETSATALMTSIKQEALDWVAAGAKDLANLVFENNFFFLFHHLNGCFFLLYQ